MLQIALTQLALVNILVFSAMLTACTKQENEIKKLQAYIPFTFLEPLTPREVNTVGNQFISELLFASYIETGLFSKDVRSYSKLKLDVINKSLEIVPNYQFKDSNGKLITTKSRLLQITEALTSSQHIKFKNIIHNIQSNDESIVIKFKEIPNNALSLLRLPDLFIVPEGFTPIKFSSEVNVPTSGPYSLVSYTQENAILKRNPFYPSELRANQVEKINISLYKNNDLDQVISNTLLKKNKTAYIYSFALTDKQIAKIEESNTPKIINDSDWLFLSFFSRQLPYDKRTIASYLLNQVSISKYGSRTNSSILGIQHNLTNDTNMMDRQDSNLTIEVATLEEWLEYPIIKNSIKKLETKFTVKLIKYPKSEILSLYNGEHDISLNVLGISKNDPIAHFHFLESVNKHIANVIKDGTLSKLATITDLDEKHLSFSRLEKNLIQNGLYLPIAYFAGVCIFSSNLKPAKDLYGTWGTRLWQLEVTN